MKLLHKFTRTLKNGKGFFSSSFQFVSIHTLSESLFLNAWNFTHVSEWRRYAQYFTIRIIHIFHSHITAAAALCNQEATVECNFVCFFFANAHSLASEWVLITTDVNEMYDVHTTNCVFENEQKSLQNSLILSECQSKWKYRYFAFSPTKKCLCPKWPFSN